MAPGGHVNVPSAFALGSAISTSGDLLHPVLVPVVPIAIIGSIFYINMHIRYVVITLPQDNEIKA